MKKLILSRKGFDSFYGRCPSPIFEDGSLLSLPIPEDRGPVRFCDIEPGLGKLVEDLSGGRVSSMRKAHLDPDLRREALPRQPGWRPLLGQSDQALRHLQRRDVRAGDLFLFFGWFREVHYQDGRYQYRRGAPHLHVLFGWMEIGEVLSRLDASLLPWARNHPHVHHDFGPTDAIYVSATKSRGAGVFRCFDERLVLTARLPNKKRSVWRLPPWFHPHGRPSTLTYHGQEDRWSRVHDDVFLRTVGRGQEFVLDCEHYLEAERWVDDLIQWNASVSPIAPATDRQTSSAAASQSRSRTR